MLWTRYFILSQKHWWTEGSLAVNMGLAASELNQHSHTEVHKKTSSLCEKWDGHLERALRKTFNDVEHWTLQLTVHFFSVIVKHGIKYRKGCNSWSNKNIPVKFLGVVENSFLCNPQNFGKKMSIGCREIAFCSVGHFWATWYNTDIVITCWQTPA